MSAPLPNALCARFQQYIEEDVSRRAAALRLNLSSATGAIRTRGHAAPAPQGRLRSTIGTQFVRYDHTRQPPDLEQFPKEVQRRRLVTAGLNRDIKYIPAGIDGAPNPMFATLDRHDDFVEVPFVGRAGSIPPDLGRKLNTEARDPVPDRFVGNRDAPRRKKILNVTQAEGKTTICPNRIADD